MEKTRITLDTKHFLKELLAIKKFNRSYFRNGFAEVNVQPGQVEIHSVGKPRYIPACTEGYYDLVVPLNILYAYARTVKTPEITLEIMNGEVRCGISVISQPNIAVYPLLDGDNHALRDEATEYHLIRHLLHIAGGKKASFEKRMEVRHALARLQERIDQAYEVLKHYHVTRLEIEELVMTKFKSVLKSD